MSAGTLMVTTASTTALSYEALADRLGITIATAKRTVHRHRWKRTRDNHGKTVVYVPDEYLARRDETFEAAQQQAQEALRQLAERRPGLLARLFRRAG